MVIIVMIMLSKMRMMMMMYMALACVHISMWIHYLENRFDAIFAISYFMSTVKFDRGA